MILAVAGLSISVLTGSSSGFMGNNTGMPGTGTCANCHGPLNSGGISLTGFPANYSPGTTYTITVSINQASNANGFQGVIIDGSNNSSGSFTSGAGSQTTNMGGNQLIVHTAPNTTGSWTFDWTAPATAAGTLTFYLVGNAANGNNISDPGDIIYSANFTSQPAAVVTASVTDYDALCNGACNGSAKVTASSGSAPYSYNWSAGSSPAAHPDSVENLCAGTYNVTVYDVQNDSVVESFTIGEPQAVTSQTVVENTSCLVDSGSILLNLSGGSAPYTVNWSGPNNYTGTGDFIDGLQAGEYVADIQDNDGCNVLDTIVVQDTASGLIVDVTTVPPGCSSSTGSITLNVLNGTPPYNYFWADGQSTATISNLASGVYSVSVTESGRSCTKEFTVSLNPADAPVVDNAVVNDVKCNGESTGSISLTVSSNNLPLSYSWSDPTATGENPTGLSAGNYTVTITDDDGCFSIHSYEIDQPASPFNLTADITNDSGNCSGEIDLTVIGNNSAAGFTAEWNTPGNDTGTLLTGLCAGNYQVTVTDVEGCEIVESYEVISGDTSGNGDSNANFVDQKRFENEIKMYPNPAVRVIYLEVPDNHTQARIYNAGGQLVKVNRPVQGKSALPIELPAGLYFVQFDNGKESTVKRLIISR